MIYNVEQETFISFSALTAIPPCILFSFAGKHKEEEKLKKSD